MKAKVTETDCQPFVNAAVAAGCPEDQVRNLIRAKVFLQERQLAASAAARLCDQASPPPPSSLINTGLQPGADTPAAPKPELANPGTPAPNPEP